MGHGEWPALGPEEGGDLVHRLFRRYEQLAVIDLSNGCQVSTLGANAFEPDHIVPNYSNDLWAKHSTIFLTFAPSVAGARDAREAIAPVATKFRHAIDRPIGFAVVSGLGWANDLARELGLKSPFRGSVIATKWGADFHEVYTYPSLQGRGSVSTSRAQSFVDQYIDFWSGAGRQELTAT